MTTPAIVMMAVSVGSVLLLFLFCIGRVLTAPAPPEDDAWPAESRKGA